ncbi:MAG: hypothetical protein JXA78_12420 [Anaerolineales bacterium]|nr:hypothetical protein [Anaerolineales bacterium]
MYRKSLFLLIVMSLLVSACGSNLPFGLGASETPTPTETVEPTATFTLAPTETATQPAQPTAQQPDVTAALPALPATPTLGVLPMIPMQGEPLLTEQFADNLRAWAGLYPGSDILVQNGSLYLKGSQPGLAAAAYCSGICGPFQVSYFFQAQLVEEAASDQGFGLVFGLDPAQDSYYNFMIRPYNGDFSLLKRVNRTWTTLLTWTAAAAIQAFPQPNTLGVSFQSGTIDLFANGTKIGTFVDPNPYNTGRIGFYIDKDNIGLFARSVAVFFQEPPAATATSLPRPTLAVTPSKTPEGACPATVPANTWVLVILNATSGRERIIINGERKTLQVGQNVFYLKLNQNHVIEIRKQVYYYKYSKCQIVYLKLA